TWLRATAKGGAIEIRGHSTEVRGPGIRGVRLVAANRGLVRVNTRDYPGTVEILATGETLLVVNEVPLEEDLAGTVKAEAGEKMPLEMLKAQAIVARTYAVYHQRLNASKPFHMVASTSHQQYAGSVPADSPVWAAVRATEGQVMLWQGALFPAFYHTDSGGGTPGPRGGVCAGEKAAPETPRGGVPPPIPPPPPPVRAPPPRAGAAAFFSGDAPRRHP